MMTLSRVRLLYIGVVLAAGVAIGFLVRANPEWQQMALPPVAWPFVVSLIIDVIIRQMAAQGRTEPLAMGDRFIAVIGASVIVALMTGL